MSRIRFLGASLIATVIGSAAMAGDVPERSYVEPPAAAYGQASAFSWTGSYAGVQGGYNWGGADITGGSSIDVDGWLGGIYGGYNYQVAPNFVVGAEGDVSLNGSDGTDGTVSVDNPWDASARLRAGYAVDRFLVYGTGGLAIGKVTARDTVSDSATRIGWTLGGGVEAAVTDHVTTRVEYRYTDLGTDTYVLSAPTEIDSSGNRLTVGLGFKF